LHNSQLKIQVFIDGNGDAEGNFTVVALLDDQEMNGTLRMSMQPVGYFQYKSNGSNTLLLCRKGNVSTRILFVIILGLLQEFKYLNVDRPIQWVGGKLPERSRTVGFYGEKCI
jgi:guanylate cyclase